MPTVYETSRKVMENAEKVIVGKRGAIQMALVALFSEGHILLEDVPGVAKTMLARALACSVGCQFRRVQCTPDLLPSDLTGISIFNQKTQEFEFHPGPILSNILLADEINRATPRTQSALLECMAERQFTVDGQTRPLPRPFLVIATQNPVEYEGTFPLPEAQLDRFLLRMSIGYPDFEDENEMLVRLQAAHPIDSLEQVIGHEDLVDAQQKVKGVFVHDRIRQYLVQIVQGTRACPDLILGASPRASQALFRASQALAAMNNRDFVLPDDIKALSPYVLEHRAILNPESRLRRKTARSIIQDVVDSVPVPVERRQ
ncbi:MAG: MoxR family ATPase [Armatimonadetes bacterium]|nr:MoxR family ATPase [Armatimonadota bacterium]